jgi:hypothetical protein
LRPLTASPPLIERIEMTFMNRIAAAALVVGGLLQAPLALATDPGSGLLYFGAGPSRSDSALESDRTPFSLGFLRVSPASDSVFGLDVAGEGTRLNSTWGQTRAVKQGGSINFLFGRNLSRSATSRFDAAFLIGARHKTAECPPSYVGYQCYADRDPDVSYGINYGVLLAWTQQRLMIGIRATGESAQGLIGFSF